MSSDFLSLPETIDEFGEMPTELIIECYQS